jgi:hypothetical protein
VIPGENGHTGGKRFLVGDALRLVFADKYHRTRRVERVMLSSISTRP